MKERTMKKKAFLTGILGIALVFATLMVVWCKDEEDENPFKGTWKATMEEHGVSITMAVTFSDDTWTMKSEETEQGSGSYTYSGNTATLTSEGQEGTATATIDGNKLTIDKMSGVVFTK
jgi:hypothetical protein